MLWSISLTLSYKYIEVVATSVFLQNIMPMRYRCFEVLLLILVFTTDVYCISLTPSHHDIVLEPPNLSGGYYDNRPPLRQQQPSNVIVSQPVQSQKQSINLCNGTYLKTNGTTCGLRNIMIGRCYEYQYVKRGMFLSNQTNIKNCSQLYQAFESAVRYKSHYNMNMSTYELYFKLALDGVHVINRAMLWSGTYSIAHAYSGHGYNYITLEDTLGAAMVNGLIWCGKENDTHGFDYISCPNNCQDNRWADVAFWGLASKSFAQLIAGEIYVVLNGSRGDRNPSFRNNSFFADFELPNFRRTGQYRVTQVNVLLLHSPDREVTEKCGEKSLLILENLVKQSGFAYACKDDPEELILIMCGEQWNARECQIARHVLRRAWDAKVFGQSSSNSQRQSFLLLFIVIILVFLL